MNRHLLMWPLLIILLFPFHPPQNTLTPPLRTDAEVNAWLNDPMEPEIVLHPLPRIPKPVEPLQDPKLAKHIEALVGKLADVADPDYGSSPTLSGHNFSPVAGSATASAFLFTNHNLKPSPVVLELVKLGPRAMPHLLNHLTDATPTKLVIEHSGFDGMMGLANELSYNPANPYEKALRGKERDEYPSHKHVLKTYTVKIGDLCFNIIGQIVGRDYSAVRYQPTAIIAINSPVADADLAKDVRSVWRSKTPTIQLFTSLLTDYSCRGIYDGNNYYGMRQEARLQCEAVMRLLYYYPRQCTRLIANRLHTLHVEGVGQAAGANHTDVQMEALQKRERANQVGPDDFVNAISWCPEPRIQAEMADIVKRTGDPDILAAAVRGLTPSQRKRLAHRVQTILSNEAPSKNDWHYDSYLVLSAIATYWGRDAEPLFTNYVKSGDFLRLVTACRALRDVKTNWDIHFLLPLLADDRPIPRSLHITRDSAAPVIAPRVCDVAANALASQRPDLKFNMDQPLVKLDQEIAAIREKIKLRSH